MVKRLRDSKGHFIKDGTFDRTKDCLLCGKAFECRSQWKYDTSKYCSIECLGLANKIMNTGKNPYTRTAEINKKMSDLKKGVPIWGGKRGALEWMTEENHPGWKGNNVGYDALHDWIARRKGKAVLCVLCGSKGGEKRGCHRANISGKYLRLESDFVSLCPTCHKRYDTGKIDRRVILRAS